MRLEKRDVSWVRSQRSQVDRQAEVVVLVWVALAGSVWCSRQAWTGWWWCRGHGLYLEVYLLGSLSTPYRAI